MPRQENAVIRERVFKLAANEGAGMGRVALHRLYAEHYGENKTPSDVTIGRYLKKWASLEDGDRVLFSHVHWPESFDRRDLPWEAAPAVLELLADLLPKKVRPSVRTAEWFWRVSQASPGLPLYVRRLITVKLGLASAGLARDDEETWRREAEGIVLGLLPWPEEAQFVKSLRAPGGGNLKADLDWVIPSFGYLRELGLVNERGDDPWNAPGGESQDGEDDED